jgi:hypothetical protein
MVFVRFENGQKDAQSREYGPFDYVQLVYSEITVGVGGTAAGDSLGVYLNGFWEIENSIATASIEKYIGMIADEDRDRLV